MALINVGIGISQRDNLIEAAKEAARKAKEELGEKTPKLLMFFCVFTYPEKDYKKSLEAIYEIFENKDIPLVGGNVLGFFAKDKYYFDVGMFGKVVGLFLKGLGKVLPQFRFKGVSVIALHSDYLSIGIGIGQNVFKEATKAGRQSVEMALENLEYNPSIAYLAMMKKGAKDITRFRPLSGFLLTPGLAPRGEFLDQEILDGIISLTKRTLRLAGGGVSDGVRGRATKDGHLFFNREVYKEAVISVIFGSDLEIGYGIGIGAKALPERVVITKAKGHIVYELNGQSPVKVLRGIYEKYSDKKINDFLTLELSLVIKGYAMGITDLKGDFYWPFLFTDIIEGKYLKSFFPMKEGIGLTFIRITPETAQQATFQAVKDMIEDAQSDDFGFILFASCAVRGQILGKRYLQEIESIKKALGKEAVPVFGICSNGEQATYRSGDPRAASLSITMMGIANRLISEVR
ncbi:FIST C-terminal domain-containing protein [bacterium]|nr:FIST C-terminal domain-containing protein [bacterium]